jgi:uncharacterized protein (TIGR02246 family)
MIPARGEPVHEKIERDAQEALMPDPELEQALARLYQDLLAAWNRRDAAAMAGLFTANGSQVGFDGSVANGRSDIESHLAPVFASRPTPAFVGKVREVRALGGAAALLRAVAGMVASGGNDINPDLNTIQTLVASRDAGGPWRIEMFHNTPAAFHGRHHEKEQLTQELLALLKRQG